MARTEPLFDRVDIVDLDDFRHFALQQLIEVQGTARKVGGKKQSVEKAFLRAFSIAPAGAYVTVYIQRAYAKNLRKWLESEEYVEGKDFSLHYIAETHDGTPLPKEGRYAAVLRLSDPALRPPASARRLQVLAETSPAPKKQPGHPAAPAKALPVPPLPRPISAWMKS